MILFDRKCRLAVGPEGDEGREIDERLRIQFDVFKSIEDDANTAEVTAWGLSESTRNLMMQEGNILRLRAGYDDPLPICILSEVVTSTILREPPEIGVRFECADGALALTNTRVSLSYGRRVTTAQALADVARRLGLAWHSTGYQPQGDWPHGWSFSGTARDALRDICYRGGVTYSIQDRALQVLPPHRGEVGEGVLISAQSGMVGTPEPIHSDDHGDGWSITALLMPRIAPGAQVMLQSIAHSGPLYVRTVRHTGDTRGADWFTEIEAYAEK